MYILTDYIHTLVMGLLEDMTYIQNYLLAGL